MVGTLRGDGFDEHGLRLEHGADGVQAGGAHRVARLHEIHCAHTSGAARGPQPALLTYPVRQSERARRLDAPAHILDRRPRFLPSLPGEPRVERGEVRAREDLEARDNALAGERVDRLVRPVLGDLDLQRALAEAKAEDFGDVHLHLRLEDDVVARYAQVNVALADKGGDVRGRKEDPVEKTFSRVQHDGTGTYKAMGWFLTRHTSSLACLRNWMSAPERCSIKARWRVTVLLTCKQFYALLVQST